MKKDYTPYHKTWLSLSELYLDTENSNENLLSILTTLKSYGFGLAELKNINKNHVFSVLHYNLISTAGEWDGFQEDWLIKTIVSYARNTNIIKKIAYRFLYYFHTRNFKKFWNLAQKNW
jgi:hypothetical protein